MRSHNSRRIRRSHPTPSPLAAIAAVDMKVGTKADTAAGAGNTANGRKKRADRIRSALSFLGKFAYRCVAGTSLMLCASPAASIVAPIIAGKPMQEFSMSW